MNETEKKFDLKSGSSDHSAAEELYQGEKRFRIVFEAAPLGIAIANAKGYILEANDAFFRLLGYSKDEIKKLTFMDITHPDDREETIKLSRKARDGKINSYQTEKRYLKQNGDYLWGIVRATVIKDNNGNLQYWLALIEDVTERKTAKQALKQTEKRYRNIL